MVISQEVIESSGDAIEKIGKSESTLFIGIMFWLLIFVWFLVWNSWATNREQRDAFLNAMEKRDDKVQSSLNKLTDALNKNTEVMVELRANIK